MELFFSFLIGILIVVGAFISSLKPFGNSYSVGILTKNMALSRVMHKALSGTRVVLHMFITHVALLCRFSQENVLVLRSFCSSELLRQICWFCNFFCYSLSSILSFLPPEETP